MAAPLTWRQVAAPELSGAGYNIRTAADLFSGALDHLGSGLKGFDQAQSDAVNKRIAAAALQLQDPAQYQAALQSGELLAGADPRRVSGETLASLGRGVSDRLATAQTGLNLREDQRDFQQRAAFDQLAPQIKDALALSNSPDAAAQQRGRQALASLGVDGLSGEQVTNLFRTSQGTESQATSNRSAAFNQGVTEQTRADETAAIDLANQIKVRAGTVDGARLMFTDPNGPVSQLNPRARALLEGKLDAIYPGMFGASGSTSPAGAALAAASGTVGAGADTVVGNLSIPGMPPPSQMTLGQWSEWAPKIRDATRNMDPKARAQLGLTGNLGSSALGAFQILPSTAQLYAKKLGWSQDVVMDADRQEQIARAVWNDVASGKLDGQSQFASLPAGDYKGVSFDSIKARLLAGESGTVAASAQRGNEAALQIATRSMQDNAQGLNGIDFATTLPDTRSVGEVADALIGGAKDAKGNSLGGRFAGTSRAFMLTQLNRIMTEAGVNAATAGAVLEKNLTGSDNDFWSPRKLIRQLTPGSTPNLGNGGRLNDRGVAQDIDALKKTNFNSILGSISAQQQRSTAQAQVQLANQALAAAKAEVTNLSLRAVTQPGLRQVELPLAMAKLQAAQAQLDQLTGLATVDPRLNVRGPAQPPAARTPGRRQVNVPARRSTADLLAAAAVAPGGFGSF